MRTMLIRSILVSLGLLGTQAAFAAPLQTEERLYPFPQYGLTLAIPELEGLVANLEQGEQQKAAWYGRLGNVGVRITLLVLPEGYDLQAPDDVTDLARDNLMRISAQNGEPQHKLRSRSYSPGAYGYCPFGSFVRLDRDAVNADDTSTSIFAMGSLLPTRGYGVEVECRPMPNEQEASQIESFLKNGIVYGGPTWDVNWTQEDLEVRWSRHTPRELHKELKKPIRTDHYVILTNSSGGKAFAKKMEANYKKINKVYPFGEVPGARLMPVFLFRTPDQYFDFCVSVSGGSRQDAERSKGHASRDYYATWYDSPNDPVHIHEATHQIVRNRMRLIEGGSWFHEGLAQYVEEPKNARNGIARLVKKGQHTPLSEFIKLPSLLHSAPRVSARGEDAAGNNYAQAGLLIEFLYQSPWGKAKFDEFLLAIGKALPGVDEAEVIQSVYGLSLDELEARFTAYCKKR